MRRVLTFLTAAVLLAGSLAVGGLTADLPFWRRALQMPLESGELYLPVAHIGAQDGATALPVDAAAAAQLDVPTLEFAVNRARAEGSRALLVMRGEQLLVSRYFGVDDEHTLLPAGLVARPLAAMAVGAAIGDTRIASLDTPVSRYLPEWDDEARGRITMRELLEETSGLEAGGALARGLRHSPWDNLRDLPGFATAKGVRLLLGNDFAGTALRFRLQHEPGGFYNASPANPQLAALIVERATQVPYEKFIDERLWRAVGAGPAEMALDRRAGMPAAHCCMRAAAPDVARVLSLLATDGMHGGRRLLPEQWVREMAQPSHVNADSGLLVARANAGGWLALSGAAEGSTFWVVPELQLTILNIVNAEGTTPPELAALLMRVFGPGK